MPDNSTLPAIRRAVKTHLPIILENEVPSQKKTTCCMCIGCVCVLRSLNNISTNPSQLHDGPMDE